MSTGSIRVVSKRKGGIGPEPGEVVIDVDRTHPVLGNRHYLRDHNDEEERERVVQAARVDFETDVATRGPKLLAVEAIAGRVQNGERVALRCWCAPCECHAEDYAHKIAEIVGIDYEPPPRPGQRSRRAGPQGSLF